MKKAFKLRLANLMMGKLWHATRTQIAQFARPAPGCTVFLGDSLTHLAKLDLLFPGVDARNLGIAGECCPDLLGRLEPVFTLQPAKLFLWIGTNDLDRGYSVDETAANVATLVARVRERLPACRIHLSGLMPRKRGFAARICALNERYRELAEERGLMFIELFPHFNDGTGQMRAELGCDLLHLDGAGYEVWRRQLAPFVTGNVT